MRVGPTVSRTVQQRTGPPRRPPVPDRLSRWQPAGQLAATIERTRFAETSEPSTGGSPPWVPLRPALLDAMDRARTYPALGVPGEWRLARWTVRSEGRHADIYLTLAARAENGDTVGVQLWARRAAGRGE